jgi:hypothetical protein
LRVYAFSSPRYVRKGLKNIKDAVLKKTEVINIFIIEANTNYYTLSEDERTLIESILSLTF